VAPSVETKVLNYLTSNVARGNKVTVAGAAIAANSTITVVRNIMTTKEFQHKALMRGLNLKWPDGVSRKELERITYVVPGSGSHVDTVATSPVATVTAPPENYYRPVRGSEIDELKAIYGLTEDQFKVAMYITDPTVAGRSLRERLAAAGCSYNRYDCWMQEPRFRNLVFNRTQSIIDNSMPEVTQSLVEQATIGNTSAFKMLHNLHKSRGGSVADSTSTSGSTTVEVLSKVIDIISRNVADPAILDKIGGELALLAGSRGVGGPVAEEVKEIE
jgi:hypothetical protein